MTDTGKKEVYGRIVQDLPRPGNSADLKYSRKRREVRIRHVLRLLLAWILRMM